jgi:hypothetical protein
MGKNLRVRLLLPESYSADVMGHDENDYYTFCMMCCLPSDGVVFEGRKHIAKLEELRRDTDLKNNFTWLAFDADGKYVVLAGSNPPSCTTADLRVEIAGVVPVRYTDVRQLLAEGWELDDNDRYLVCPNTGMRVSRENWRTDKYLTLALIETYGAKAYMDNALTVVFDVRVRPVDPVKNLCTTQQGNN